MEVLYYILISTFVISLIAFVGALSLAIKKKLLRKILLFLVSLSAGALMGGAFLHLIPEALEKSENIFFYVLVGFILFFLVEKILHWHHCIVKSKISYSNKYYNFILYDPKNILDPIFALPSEDFDRKQKIFNGYILLKKRDEKINGTITITVFRSLSETEFIYTYKDAVLFDVVDLIIDNNDDNMAAQQ